MSAYDWLLLLLVVKVHVSAGRAYIAHADNPERDHGRSGRFNDAEPRGVYASQPTCLDGCLLVRHSARHVHVTQPCALFFYRRGVVGNASRMRRSHSTPGPVST